LVSDEVADLGTMVRHIEKGRHFTPEVHPDVVSAEVNALVQEAAGTR